jgi:hypothetical protein
MSDPRINEMRSIIIYSVNSVTSLKNVNNWSLELLDIPGASKYCLRKGEVKIALSVLENSTIITSNILPYEWDHDQDKANQALIELKKDLIDSGIQCAITASDKDLGKQVDY